MTAHQYLEDGLEALLDAMDADLDGLRRVAPRLAAMLVQTSVSTLVLEYVLQSKQLVDPDELKLALTEAQAIVRRLGGLSADA
jgi:hypothetical protein